jgi:hypothetical protein
MACWIAQFYTEGTFFEDYLSFRLFKPQIEIGPNRWMNNGF